MRLVHASPPNGWRTFLIVWITQTISAVGSTLTFFALTIWVTQVLYPLPEQKPELGFALSAMGLAFGLPTVFIAPVAGAFVDRNDRRRTMLVTDLIQALISVTLTILVATGALTLWLLIPLMALLSAAGSFHAAAFDTSYVMLVPERLLARANGMMQTSWSFANVVAPMLAAAIIAVPGLAREGLFGSLAPFLGRLADGTALVTGIDAITFALGAVALVFLHIPSPERADLTPATGKPKKSLWADIRQGAAFIFERPALLWLLASFTVANFALASMNVLGPMIVKFNLGPSREILGLSLDQALGQLGSLAGIGGVVGGLLISTWGGLKSRRVLGVLLPMLLTAGALSLYGFSPTFYLTAAMAFLIQFTMPLTNAHSQAIWQTTTPREMQGRVFSVRRLIAWVSNPLATTLAGLLGGYLNPGTVIGTLGLLFFAFTFSQLFNRSLLRVDQQPTSPSTADLPLEQA